MISWSRGHVRSHEKWGKWWLIISGKANWPFDHKVMCRYVKSKKTMYFYFQEDYRHQTWQGVGLWQATTTQESQLKKKKFMINWQRDYHTKSRIIPWSSVHVGSRDKWKAIYVCDNCSHQTWQGVGQHAQSYVAL